MFNARGQGQGQGRGRQVYEVPRNVEPGDPGQGLFVLRSLFSILQCGMTSSN